MLNKLLSISVLWILLFTCRNNSHTQIPQKIHISKTAMLVTAHPLASQVGKEILMKGGNAMDAALSTQFALAVVNPRAGNLGGGGFLVYADSLGNVESLDFREKAPNLAHRDMYLNNEEEVIKDLSTLGHLAVGVPGTVDGLFKAHQKFGKISDLTILLEPAIKLARNGFAVSKVEADRLNKFKDEFLKVNDKPIPFVKEEVWKAGDLLIQKELASTMERIVLKGREGFYNGQTAGFLLEEMRSHKGLINQKDLDAYSSIWRKPIKIKYEDYDIFSMPLPSSGGLVLAQLFSMLEENKSEKLEFLSRETVHLFTELERRAYSDRAKHMGDSDFYHVPIDTLLNKEYLLSKLENFSVSKASESEDIMIGDFIPKESYETTHTSIIDEDGNCVSLTTTLNANYGSKVYVDGAGFFLNNEMDDFSAKPGVPNLYGLVGGEANAIANP